MPLPHDERAHFLAKHRTHERGEMSYHDFTPSSREGQIGKEIYLTALDDRRGFRYDQLGIDDDEIWEEIFVAIGLAAINAVQAPRP